MDQFIVKRWFKNPLITGLAAILISFVIAMIYWPVWGTLAKMIITNAAREGLQLVDAKTAAKYISVFAEGTFFWIAINPWIWLTLLFGTYGKTKVTNRQPGAGVWYALIGLLSGLVCFLVIVGFLGIWWKPFNLSLLFYPKSAEEVHLAIEGWEAGNFFALTVILVQIPFASIFQKWPFAGNIKAPWDGFGAMMMSMVAALLVWFAAIIPSFMKLSIGEQIIVSQPMGSWPTFVAFCQCFIFWSIMPAEGAESYPMKLFAKKQPGMAIAGIIISFVMAFATLAFFRLVITPFDLLPGMPADLVIASLMLSIIVATLMWHHVFDDFPSAALVPNQAARIFIRIAIWIVLGLVLGVIWIKTFRKLPFGANDMGMSYPTMGILAGQFAFLMVFLYYNTFFDKWPLVRKVPADKK
jgi:hypothetical protein